MAKNWLEKYNDGGPVQPNYNDAQASTGPGYVGTGYDTTGRNYSPAWGGQFQNGGFLQKAKSFPVIEDIEKINEHGLKVPDWEAMTKQAKQLGAKQVRTKHGATIIFDNNWEVTGATDPDPELAKLQMGGSMPGAVGFTYARTAGSAPDNGKYAKKTKASAQNGKEIIGEYIPSDTNGEKTIVHQPGTDADGNPSDKYMVKKTITPYTSNRDIKKNTPIPKTPSDVNFISNYKGALGVIDDYPTSVPIEGDKHWNIDRFILEDPAGAWAKESPEKIRNSILAEQYKYQMLQDPENKNKDFRKAKQFVRQEIDPRINGAFYKDYYTNPNAPFFGSSITNFANENPVLKLRALNYNIKSDIMDLPSNDEAYSKNMWDENRLKKVSLDYLKTFKKMSKSQANEQYKKWVSDADAKKGTYEIPEEGLEEFRKEQNRFQNGGEMQFYQNGLDWKPNNISRDGSVIKDDRGQWAHPGEITEIGSNNITMEGVDYPVLGVSDTGDTKLMQPGEDYKFKGTKVTEYPQAQNGWLGKYDNQSDATRVTPKMIPLSEEEKRKNLIKQSEQNKRDLDYNQKVIAERKKARDTKGSVTEHNFDIGEKYRAFPNSVGGPGQIFDDYINPAKIVADRASSLGNSRTPLEALGSIATTAGFGALGFNPAEDAALLVKGIPKATRVGLNTIDRNFSSIGKNLAEIEAQGLQQGLSPYEIKQMQMNNVGITSAQREAYVPGVSDFLSKHVTPYGYEGTAGESKLIQTLKNIKRGRIETPSEMSQYRVSDWVAPAREDSWNLYLGKPQVNNTFRIAETTPVNHPAYNPEQLSNMDIYSINEGKNTKDITPQKNIYPDVGYDIVEAVTNPNEASRVNVVKERLDLLKNGIVNDRHMPVMGGYNKRLSSTGLDYNDIWDLEPIITNPITKKPTKVRVDDFIGKPFMSHGVFPEITTDSETKFLNNIIDTQKNKISNKYNNFKFNKDNTKVSNTPNINSEYFDALHDLRIDNLISKNVNKLKEELKGYSKKNGGWLNKYK